MRRISYAHDFDNDLFAMKCLSYIYAQAAFNTTRVHADTPAAAFPPRKDLLPWSRVLDAGVQRQMPGKDKARRWMLAC